MNGNRRINPQKANHLRGTMHHRQLFTLTSLALACMAATGQTLFAPTMGEYNWSTSVSQLGIKGVHGKGILGRGVIVGVLDTGLNLSNPEFKGNVNVMKAYNAVNGSSDVTDALGHGTHVAGIIGAPGNGTGMYGVAPGVTILPVKVFNGSTAASTAIDSGLAYAMSKGARVINLSLGANGATGDAGLRRVVASNSAVVVASAGNDGLANPGWPARYAKETWAAGTIIAVGAVDANNKLASFSNKAGDTAQFYLVAPGVNIISSYSTGYAYMSGTSMAAPAVSGAAALVTGYWPYLKASQVAAILLNTADDLGAAGVDAVYGRGLLNVNKALAPIGSFTYKTATGVTTTIALTGKSVVSVQPKVTTPSAFAGLSTEVFDEYGRNFTSDEGAQLSARSQMTLESALGRTDRLLDTAEQLLSDGTRFTRLQLRTGSVHADQARPGSVIAGTQAAPQASLMSVQLASGHGFSAGDGGLGGLALGLMGSNLASNLTGADSVLANPLLGFAPQHRFAALSAPLVGGWSTRLGMVRATPLNNAASANVNVLELTHQGRHHAFNVSAGQMNEQGLLGGYSNAVAGLAQQTATFGMTLSGALKLGGPWTLAGAYTSTHTKAPQASGILVGATGIQSDGYGIGLVKADTWRTGDRWSFTLNAPLRATSGTLRYSVVTGVTDDGTPIHGTHVVKLDGTAREVMAETRYVTRLSASSTLSAVMALRHHPDNDASATDQVVVGTRFDLMF
ncbi:MAG: hypothetical protein EOP38_22420 [Rubrivivax sp.]|nr:MAG: hypothetical protein EOP38_22420 [Rubrivivax sp.]